MLDYTDIEIPDHEELDRLLSYAKSSLFFHHGAGFLGTLLCDHTFVWDETCDTAWCNGKTIGWNPRFFFWLTHDERVTVLAHELWHTGCFHMVRIQKRDPDRWNQAADFFINLMLQKAGYKFGDKLMSLVPCLDPQYDNMSTEEIYDLLPATPQPPSGGGGGSTDSPLSGDVRALPEGATPQDVATSVMRATQTSKMSKEAGVIPGETTLTIEHFLNPIIPWTVKLARFMTALGGHDYSWKRPSRRHTEEYLPSIQDQEEGLEHLIYFLDISGSVSDGDILRFNSEVKYIHDELKPEKLTLITFDTALRDEYVFEREIPFEKIVVTGRGGTSLTQVYDRIVKEKPTAAVIFSDLYVAPMPDPRVPVLWVVVGNAAAAPAFGEIIHIPQE